MGAAKSSTSAIQGKFIIQVSLALIPIAFCIYFLKHRGYQLNQSFALIKQADIKYVIIALLLSIIYILVHGYMYKSSFKTLQAHVTFKSSLILALKRNFISVFLPAGGVSSYAFFTQEIKNHGISNIRIHLASVVFGIAGFASLFIIAIPAMIILAFSHKLGENMIIAFIILTLIFLLLFMAFRSFLKRGFSFQVLSKYFPGLVILMDDLQNQEFSIVYFLEAILFSFIIELCGIAHLYFVSYALGIKIELSAALIGYAIATIMYALSPFMRGLGAVELTLSLTLVGFGIPKIEAISISLLYRFFEFWLPLIISAGSFFYKKKNLLLRVLPALLTLILGLVNIFSVLTPGIAERVALLRDFIPENIRYFSSFTVIISGVILIILSAYLMRGLRNSWIATLIIISFSVIGHLTKAIDYEEAIFALIVLFLLIYTRENYFVKSDKKLFHNTKWYFAGFFLFVFTYGITGFYLLSKIHFGADLDLWHSFLYLINSLLIFNNDALTPYTHFARWFVHSLNFLGAVIIFYSLYLILKPYRHITKNEQSDIEKANALLKVYGKSSLDYFKVYPDKSIYLGSDASSFVSFKIVNDYAFVLESPVCESESKLPVVIFEFDKYCLKNGLRTMYYRVDEQHLKYFEHHGKRALYIGQEGIVDLSTFTLEGGDKKPERNALNKMKSLGYKCIINCPPQKDGLLQKLKQVSDDWLNEFNKKETAFTQGIWNTSELKNLVILSVENEEEKVVAFANIIPDYAPDEGTYDLIRKMRSAPHGVLDMLMINMIAYFKDQNKKYLNLGMAPFSGIEQAKDFKEKTIKFAYDNLKQFDHFKGLRFFKEKYAYAWQNKFLVYDTDFDLLQAPILIDKVSRVKDLMIFQVF
jgi:phosphatidylglycerol lysyltransferase